MSFCKLPTSKTNKDLIKNLNNRQQANALYELSLTPEFRQAFSDRLIYNNEGEPTVESILSLLDTSKSLKEGKYISFLEESLNAALPVNNVDVVKRAVDFNKNNKSYIAVVVDLNKNKSKITVQPRNADTIMQAQILENNLKNFNVIDNFLNKLGITVKILDPIYFKNEDALTIPSNINPLENGLFGVINIANNFAGFKSITEEFSHFVIECCQNNPVIQRCETYLREHPEAIKEILGSEYESVVKYYVEKNRPDLITRECLGRLMADSINNNKKQNTSLLQRGIDNAKTFLQKFKLTTPAQIQELENMKSQLQEIVTQFLNRENLDEQTINILQNDKNVLAHSNDEFDTTIKQLFDRLQKRANKFVRIYSKQDFGLTETIKRIFTGEKSSSNYATTARQLLTEYIKHPNKEHSDTLMQLAYFKNVINSSNNMLAAQMLEVGQMLSNIEQHSIDFNTIIKYSHIIRKTQNLILVYSDVINELLNELTLSQFTDELDDKEQYFIEKLEDDLLLAQRVLGKTKSKIEDLSYKLIYQFYAPTFNPNEEDIIKLEGTTLNKEQVISLTDVLHHTKNDISFFKRLMDTGYNSTDLLTQLVSTKIKQQQEKIRLQTQLESHNLHELLKRSKTLPPFDIYERKANGDPTGYYINKYGIDFKKYEDEKKKAEEAIDNEKITEPEKINKKRKWYFANTREVKVSKYIQVNNLWVKSETETVTIRIPKNNVLWNSDKYSKLSEAQQDLVDDILEYKHKMDYINGLTGQLRPFKCVQKTISSLTEGVLQNNVSIGAQLKRYFSFTDEDNEVYGGQINDELMSNNVSFWVKLKTKIKNLLDGKNDSNIKETVTQLSDFENKVYKQVPLSYVNDLQNISQLSTNTFDALLHYTAATYQHEGMNEIVDIMELTKQIAKKRTRKVYDAKDRKLVARYGRNEEDLEDIEYDSSGDNVNLQIENIINTQIYSEYKQKGSTIFNDSISVNKLIDGLLRLTSFTMLGYNPFTGKNNVIVGKSQMLIKSFGSNDFTTKDWLRADKEYGTMLKDYLAEIGEPYKTSKMALIEQLFNPHNDWWDEVTHKGIYKPKALKAFETIAGPSFFMQAGEHHMKMSTCLAILLGTEMLDDKGNKTNLFDSLQEVEVPNSNGIGTHKELAIKKGYTKIDGSEFTLNAYGDLKRSDLQTITDKMTITNHRLHGLYDKEDYIEAKKYAIGRIFLLFRNFMYPFFSRRWKGVKNIKGLPSYNIQLQTADEGYYVTTIKFLKQLFFPNVESLRECGTFSNRCKTLIAGLNKTEKNNLVEMLVETFTTLLVWALLYFMFRDWDDDEGNWILRNTNYFLRRLQQEMTYAWNPETLMDILQSPTPVMSPLKDITRIIKSIGDDHILQSGPYKGQTRLKANIKRAMPIIPNWIDYVQMDTEDKKFKVFEDSFFYKNSKEASQTEN